MRAIVTVIGKDKVGIIAKVSEFLTANAINIEDISQTIMQEFFVMIMLVDIAGKDVNIAPLSEKIRELGKSIGVDIRLQHEDIFNAMHKI